MNKVKFSEGEILVNGVSVGRLEGPRSEVWVVLKSIHSPNGTSAVARFKYMKATTRAKHWIKWLLERHDADTIVKAIGFDVADANTRPTPADYARQQGYEPAPL